MGRGSTTLPLGSCTVPRISKIMIRRSLYRSVPSPSYVVPLLYVSISTLRVVYEAYVMNDFGTNSGYWMGFKKGGSSVHQ